MSLLGILALFFSLPVAVHAQESAFGTGLEIDNYQSVGVFVAPLPKDAEQIGLTEDRLQTRVELRLRQAKLKPVKIEKHRPAYLYVDVNMVGNAFAIRVVFIRPVSYPIDPTAIFANAVGTAARSCMASTWVTLGVGTYRGDSEFIVQSLDEHLDKFLNEYLKANGQ